MKAGLAPGQVRRGLHKFPEIMERVVDKFIKELFSQLSAKKVSLTVSPEARSWLAKKGYDPKFGARPLTRLVQTEIKDILADQILKAFFYEIEQFKN